MRNFQCSHNRRIPETVEVQIKNLDEKFKLLLEAQDKAVQVAMTAAEKAVTKAEDAADKRFESVNEFRKTLSDQTASFLTRNEFQVQHKTIVDKLDIVSSKINELERMVSNLREIASARKDVWGVVIGSISILISLGVLIILFLSKLS